MKRPLVAAVSALSLSAAHAQADTVLAQASPRTAGIVTINAGRPSSLPLNIPTTVEGITGAEIEQRINATDSEDALKYFPSLLVRKRYIGDYNHAVLSSRASGTGNSARSMVYADGIVLSNYLGNGASFTPRWGMVTPEEIERVDVLYGPFSAAYAGNSVGAVVDYVTRMPTAFEGHASVTAFSAPFQLYNSSVHSHGLQGSVSVGDRQGPWAWWINLNRLDSQGQPLTFATKLNSTGTTTGVGTAVTGAVQGLDKSNQPWLLLGEATRYHTVQDHAKLKATLDVAPGLKAQYTMGWWSNLSAGQSESYLKRSDGSTFYSGVASIDGRNYTVAATDFGQTRERLNHEMHGLTLQGRGGAVAWDLTGSVYDYVTDLSRTPTVAKPAADAGGAGRITDLAGTGWSTLAYKGAWRAVNSHLVEFGAQQEVYQWRQRIDNAGNWISGSATTPVSAFSGNTRLRSLWAQDSWGPTEQLKAVVGGRLEQWSAWGGTKSTGVAAPVAFQDRTETWFSPKLALGWQLGDVWALKASAGRAVRAPTVGELFQGNAGTDVVTNPGLKPEKSWTHELTAEAVWGSHRWRATLFHERTTDALYSQAIAGTSPVVNSVQNIDRIHTRGLETALDMADAGVKGLDLQGGLTFTDSRIKANSSYVATPGDTIGKQQPRVPKWRASLAASYRLSPAFTASYGMRYGSEQFGTLNNSDPNGFAYQGFSKYFTTDLRLRHEFSKRWSLALGIDNLNNATYWNFHPYPQRTYSAELKAHL